MLDYDPEKAIRIVGIEPWCAAGPGWANTGITYVVQGLDGKRESYTIYSALFETQEQHLAFRVAKLVYPILQRLCLDDFVANHWAASDFRKALKKVQKE